MEDLDKTLDIMERDKCTSLLAENAVRLKKNNIKFTKTNKKHSQEHLDAQLDSYERLVRTLIKGLITIEKKVRLKYLVPLDSVRANKLKASWNTEVECILEDLKKKYRDVHLQRRSDEEFDDKVLKNLEAAKIKVDMEVANLEQKLKTEIQGSEKIQPSELSRMYDMDVTALIDLQVIDQLQNLQVLCKKLKDSGCDDGALIPVNEIIRMYVKEIKSVEATVWSGRSADQRKEIKMRAAKLNLNLKEIVLSLHDLANQAILEKEKRNEEVIIKIRNNLDKIFKSEKNSESFQSMLEPFLGILV
ncbi:MAG: hypothetical protein HN646_06860 [Nitrospina sp.]|nr:hypothetical protein [Nitrospina sp.]MBT7521976.1 hypothetical protein [Nitrospina sp.]